MNLLVDENIRKEVIAFLKGLGHDVARVPGGGSDAEIAQIARLDKRIIITHDKHFSNILAYPPKLFCGIIRIKIHPPRAETVINALTKLFAEITPARIDKKLIILEKNGFRIR